MNNLEDNVYKSITKKEIRNIFLIGGIVGIIIFLCCYGWQTLDVTYDDWLLTGQDISQHYIGWKFFRNSDWSFPIGEIDGILYPNASSIIFSDSIPFFAIIFKLLSPILPATFQYFGIWGCLTYFLTGGIGTIIIRKSTENKYLCLLGGAIFCFSPYMFQRMYEHTALAGHWILLAAIGIWIYKPYFSTFCRKFAAWGSLLIIGSLVHIYFIPMIMIFMFGFCLQDLLENKGWKQDLVFVSLIVAADLLVLYMMGAFVSYREFQDEGLGKYSANLNSLFNPNNRAGYLETFPINDGQDEGFGYLGMGILFLFGCAVALWLVYRIYQMKKKNMIQNSRRSITFAISVVTVLVIAFVIALSPKVTLGTETLLEFDYPEFVEKILSTFRASGRFIWCVGYMIMTFSMMTVCRYGKRAAASVCMLAALITQIADMHWMIQIRQRIVQAQNQVETIESVMWEELAEDKEHIAILPYSTMQGLHGILGSYAIGNFAADQEMTINYFPMARIDFDLLASNDVKYMANTVEGASREDTMYILDSEEKGKSLGLDVYYIDGYYIGITGN